MAATTEKFSNNIPDDIVFYILSKLPVKSLKRFGCVRKSWANLFENPQFMSLYRNNLLSEDDDDNSRLLLLQSMQDPYNRWFHDSMFLLSGERFENRVKLDWSPPFQESNTNFFILGSAVNGIFCLYQGSDYAPKIALKVVLWNPTTEEFKVIPPSGSVDCVDNFVGFGYDPMIDDYKLIQRIWKSAYDFWGNDVPYPSWRIYNLRSNSWRKLNIEMPYNPPYHHELYLNGVSHWWLDNFSEMVLVSFNWSDEVFHTTLFDRKHINPHLAALKGSIAIITSGADTACFDISILGELGVKESWTKLFSNIGPLPGVVFPIGFGKKGNIFFIKNDDELAWFDLSSQVIEDIGIKGKDSFCRIVIYEESLLRIGG